MRKIDRRCSDLATGYQRIIQLEKNFTKEWGESLSQLIELATAENARLENEYNKSMQGWNARHEEARLAHERAYSRWLADEAPKKAFYEKAHFEWKMQCYRIQQESTSLTSAIRNHQYTLELVNNPLFLIAGILIGFLILICPGYLLIAFVVLYPGYAKNQIIHLQEKLRNLPPFPPAPKYVPSTPEPARPTDEPRPAYPTLYTVDRLDHIERWWQLIANPRPLISFPERITNGIQGEQNLISALSSALSDDFLLISGAMANIGLDIDVTVLGKNGIWVLDSKYFNGSVTYSGGIWRKEKEYYIPGGRGATDNKLTEYNDINTEWGREYASVANTMRIHASKHRSPEIKGGIVFTHDNCTLDIGSDCPVRAGEIRDWVLWIFQDEEDQNITVFDLIRCADYIIEFSDTIEPLQRHSAVALAEEVGKDIAERIQQIHSRLSSRT